MTNSPTHAVWESTRLDNVKAVHDLVEVVWTDMPAISGMDRSRFETALVELASNIFLHAGVDGGVTIDIQITTFPDRIEATLVHLGVPCSVQIAGRTMPSAMAESGRGIPLVQALVDELHFDTDGDRLRWRIMKRFAS